MAEREELKSLLIKVKEESVKATLKLNIQKTKIIAPGLITSWQIDGETAADFILGGLEITADGDCNYEIKRRLLLLLLSHSVVSDSVRPHRRQPTRLTHPWDSPGKNTGVACHFLLQYMQVKSEVAQSCPTLSNPMDCSLLGSSVHGIFPGKSTGVGWHYLL